MDPITSEDNRGQKIEAPLAKQMLMQLSVQECYHPIVDASWLFIMLKNI